LGGGLAGVSLASFLKDKTVILESESRIGGLCRSFDFHGIKHDIGPHILFSKNKKNLNILTSVMHTRKVKRSNKIFHKGRFIKYPFENELSALNKEERDYCLREFLNNPYRNYPAKTMMQFFLKNFGEGITNLYLALYNRKIWKFDPEFMDTQIVERIPRPPDEDIIKSAKGIKTEGYLHQLYFNYPISGGIESLVKGFAVNAKHKCEIYTSVKIQKIIKRHSKWKVYTSKGIFTAKRLINCMPLHELFKYIKPPKNIKQNLSGLKYNSIHITALKVKKDKLGNNYVINFAGKDTVFHRLSKIGFLGNNYKFKDGSNCLVAEVTFRPDSYLAKMPKQKLTAEICSNLHNTGLVHKKDILKTAVKTFKYAYVIYDLNHKKNAAVILKYLKSADIECCGRFAEFEYLNMDKTVSHSLKLARKLNR
jgi:protoporphyrinogen oxidase